MPSANQTDCFSLNKKFWKILAIDPLETTTGLIYYYYSKLVVIVMVYLYVALATVNFYFLDPQLDKVIEEMLFYFTEVAVTSKVITFIVMHKEIAHIFKTIDKEMFQPVTDKEFKVIESAKNFNVRYWKIVAAVSVTANINHVILPVIKHLFLSIKLELPVSSYSFIPEETKERFVYPIYFYQSLGMHFIMWYNINIDSFFLGLMILVIAQLDILDEKLRNITHTLEERRPNESRAFLVKNSSNIVKETKLVLKLNKSVVHFDKVSKFCSIIQEVFGVTLFVQFGVASIIICVCLIRFTMPAPLEYLIFLASYMFCMITQIMVPCWFGTRIMVKSTALSNALYNCDWTTRPRHFKTNLRLFVERTSKPLCIIGWKIFPLSLTTFSSIINSSYSFFTLLRHMQAQK